MDRVRAGQEGLGPHEVSPTCPDGGGQEEGRAGQAVLSFLGRLLEPSHPDPRMPPEAQEKESP